VQQGTWKAFAGSARPTVVLSRTNGRRLTLMPNYESVDADEFVADIIAAWAERR
jgi:hypothetical protein